MTFSKLAYKI
ncbi:hypothetical protein FG05_35060 [Fusarium graminearum]|nr:hypothetical protein FG05_35060 [Fusarium graminearum]